jgi:hypothetical protein
MNGQQPNSAPGFPRALFGFGFNEFSKKIAYRVRPGSPLHEVQLP